MAKKKEELVLIVLCQQGLVCACTEKEAQEYTEYERLSDINEPLDEIKMLALRAKIKSKALPHKVFLITGDFA